MGKIHRNHITQKYNNQEIFAFNQSGITEQGEVIGEFVLNKATLKTYDRLKSRGITNLKDIFE